MKKLLAISTILIALLISACSESSNPLQSGTQGVDEQFVLKKTKSLAEGISYRADNSSADKNQGEWEVTVTMSNGALVKYSYTVSGELREVKGLTGPFEYELRTGEQYVLYSYARKSALKAVTGEITFWKFQKDESDNRFEYRFDITKDNRSYEVRLHAVTGDVIRVR
jgi:uncharacterized membrane protein YkoI